MEKTVFVKLRHRVQVKPRAVVVIGDVAQITANDSNIAEQLKAVPLYRIQPSDKNIVIIDVMKVIRAMMEKDDALDVQVIGPAQTIIEVVDQKRRFSSAYFLLVWMLLFVGSAMAIMNFHEDVSMQEVHQHLYEMITGKKNDKPLLLQIPYSLGLGIGMILFFNHVFRKRINEEPSPLEVEMFNYQQSLDQYVILYENKESMGKIDDD
ncbi:stage V sporulation protein AA [Parageobacillus thermoglucosidasius]|uniref:Stage V sporulation protein AA n=2 Tax=Anoxybacillaceae TaxID=3120669 RepID=A0AB38QVZ3_PARTM|nr:stage V sporulation protein AA [Parageobacillus thermoglucosidasius]AEH47349.1 stage V sporulation protein AA [Parageobacillus thermoglucosidasius C56-YS93]MBY6268088.1 stage V sporulation protein AA [Parageobacillus thermoglucosidasius]OUM92749.1 MAG: stage V sporulation protein AA [Parageobacillus thermoglucosidasius]RDE23945.1 stage V sporulation protein AA [Parageobacillus thermoglucosidasius]RDE31693.1 stage V sporulation protein AA [Parageobacillus thermoglucosidasius]